VTTKDTQLVVDSIDKAPEKARKRPGRAVLVRDDGTEPVDDSLPPDGEDIIHEQDRRRGIPLTPSHLIVQVRQQRCLELRIAGVKWPDIAREMGYGNPGSAYHAAAAARKRWGTPDEGGVELRSLLYNRLNEQLQRLWPLALGGYPIPDGNGGMKPAPPSLPHSNEVRMIMKQMADLMGANVPVVTNTNISGGVLHGVVGSVDHQVSGAVIHTEWDEERFIAEMKRSTVDGARALPAGEGDIIDAVVIEQEPHEVKPPSGYIAPRYTATEFDGTAEDVVTNSVDEKTKEEVFDPRKAIEL
jgi:hypothetical protein